jgi:short-subunit dehydrogenase
MAAEAIGRIPPVEHPWSSALVTGASSGIGEAIARRLGRAGVDVVVVARRADLLADLADSIEADPGRSGRKGTVEVLAADLVDPAERRRVAARIGDRDRPIDLVVNSAGLAASGRFVDGDLDHYHRVIDLNIEALVDLNHAAVGPMIDRQRGWIMNISSLGGHSPGPGFAVYSATKGFVTSFSESLHEEVKGSGVVVTAVCPGATKTDFAADSGIDNDLPAALWQTADQVADEALAGTAAGRAVRVTGRINRTAAAVTTVLPRSANRWLSARVTDRI